MLLNLFLFQCVVLIRHIMQEFALERTMNKSSKELLRGINMLLIEPAFFLHIVLMTQHPGVVPKGNNVNFQQTITLQDKHVVDWIFTLAAHYVERTYDAGVILEEIQHTIILWDNVIMSSSNTGSYTTFR